jgi:hypothetical protein
VSSEPYTITQADVEGCRLIVAQLEELDAKTGGYSVGNVRGHKKSATATVHYRRGSDPFTTGHAISYALDSVPNLGVLCKKVIAHFDTHSIRDGEPR